ncbi:hypothetical protein JW752_00740 [Candidatus Peregrinibacteria bacterium]|nr:hypothetical protein [Candidatus Peregrinibacteria bacterium]
MKKLFLIIGIVLMGTGLLVGMPAYAQNDETYDCENTLYSPDFRCQRENTFHYCSPLSQTGYIGGYNIYKNAYCNITEEVEDEVIDVLVEQFQPEDPNWDRDQLEFVLYGTFRTSIEQFLTDVYGKIDTSKLPATVREAYFENKNFSQQNKLYERVKKAYDREKIIHQSKESLKQQFKNNEIWANGDLIDSPFDLIVDLNLIELILFGSKAQWVDDVYSFGDTGGGGGSGGIDEGVGGGEGEGEGEGEEDVDQEGAEDEEGEQPVDEYECISDEEYEELFGEEGQEEDALAEGEPEPGNVPANCGNLRIDPEEECDDGNTRAGDGCSEACLKESGTSLSCQDPDAVTFRQLPDSQAGGGGGGGEGEGEGEGDETGGGEPPISCPEGSTPVDKHVVDRARGVEQSPNYPGPFVGGVLKNFPPSNKPACAQGETAFSITIGSDVKTRCVPTKLCADPDDFRAFLMDVFGLPAEAVEPIEAVICIDVFTYQRPESPYPMEAGCVDCHILAMNDVMEKLLENNIAPLENNMTAWGMSNRWGPNFTFDLVTSVKSKLRMPPPKYKDKSPLELAEEYFKKNYQDAQKRLDPNEEQDKVASPIMDILAVDYLQEKINRDIKAQSQLDQSLKNYRMVTDAEVDQQFHNDVPGLLNQILQSFGRLQDKYIGLSLATTFATKEKCEF